MDFIERADGIDIDADYVFVFGGTNDYGHGLACLGSKDDTSPYTFYGAVKCLFDKILLKTNKEKVCVILPCRRFNDEVPCGEGSSRSSDSLKDYVEGLKEMSLAYGLGVLDLYNDGFPLPMTNMGDEYTMDGLHPNDKGYALIAEKVIEYIKNDCKRNK